jgi:hypothetical protein
VLDYDVSSVLPFIVMTLHGRFLEPGLCLSHSLLLDGLSNADDMLCVHETGQGWCLGRDDTASIYSQIDGASARYIETINSLLLFRSV